MPPHDAVAVPVYPTLAADAADSAAFAEVLKAALDEGELSWDAVRAALGEECAADVVSFPPFPLAPPGFNLRVDMGALQPRVGASFTFEQFLERNGGFQMPRAMQMPMLMAQYAREDEDLDERIASMLAEIPETVATAHDFHVSQSGTGAWGVSMYAWRAHGMYTRVTAAILASSTGVTQQLEQLAGYVATIAYPVAKLMRARTRAQRRARLSRRVLRARRRDPARRRPRARGSSTTTPTGRRASAGSRRTAQRGTLMHKLLALGDLYTAGNSDWQLRQETSRSCTSCSRARSGTA